MATEWKVVPNLEEARHQLDEEFPHRDHESDGGIGNEAHARETSSHNPDKSGSAEWKDGDSKNEVRARDFDKDLKDPSVTMEMVVQLWVKLARAGVLWWVRYIIFNGRIWHKRDGFKTRTYTGKNKHDKHVHVNSDFTQKADEVTGTNWRLKDLRKKPAPSKPAPKPSVAKTLRVDGNLGPETIKKWRDIMGVNVTTSLSKDFVKLVQKHLNEKLGLRGSSKLAEDGDLGPASIRALQRYLKSSTIDGKIDEKDSAVVRRLQMRLNEGHF
jgi:hypothetical protein